MAGVERFIAALLGNIVFLICLLPLVGAVLTLLSARISAGHARSTALTNALLTLSLTLLMAANYDPPENSGAKAGQRADIQMTSAFDWIRLGESRGEMNSNGATIHMAVGVDGISLWPIVLTALLTVAAIAAVGSDSSQQRPTLYALLLLQQSLAIGLFAALDAVLFCVFLQLTLVPMYFLIGGGNGGGYHRRPLALGFLLLNLAGSLAATIGLMSVLLIHAHVAGSLTLTIPHFMESFPDIIAGAGANDWNSVGPWILGALLIGFAVRLPLVPFHTWFVSTSLQASAPTGMLLCGLFPVMGLYGLTRFVAPLLDVSDSTWATGLQAAAVGGSIYCGLLAWGQRDLRRLIAFVGLGWIHLGAAGVLSLTPSGTTGGFLCVGGLSLTIGALWLTFNESVHQPRFQRRTSWTVACTLALLGVPGSAAFVGGLLTLMGLFSVNEPAAVGGMLGWLLSGCALVRVAGESFPHGESSTKEQQETAGIESGFRPAVLALLLAIILWVGLYPEFFTHRMQSSIGRLFHVEAGNAPRSVFNTKPSHRATNN